MGWVSDWTYPWLDRSGLEAGMGWVSGPIHGWICGGCRRGGLGQWTYPRLDRLRLEGAWAVSLDLAMVG